MLFFVDEFTVVDFLTLIVIFSDEKCKCHIFHSSTLPAK